MKSRLAILAMLVTGMLFSTAGAGLAVQGFAEQATENAAVSQYGTDQPQGGVLPTEAENAPDAGVEPAQESAPAGVAPAVAPSAPTQAERQVAVAADTSQLPFTGFAAIPVLIGGLALLTGGLLLRRRTR